MTEYRIYHRIQSPLFMAYGRGDRLWFDAAAHEVAAPAPGVHDPRTALLERIFERHNRPDRPDGPYAPSLSVGDLVALDWGTEETTFWAVGRVGWVEVEGPFFTQVVNAAEDLGYFAALDRLEVGA